MIIGIDLGTTNSLVGVWKDGEVSLIANAHGDLLTPSAVSVTEDRTILVGAAAKDRVVSHPHKSASEFKRYMGAKKTHILGGAPYSSEELSALVLGSLKRDAENYLGESVTEAVISVPAYFNNKQRQATQRAAELAGLTVERLINEPSAAALAYGLQALVDADADQSLSYLVLDLGGGTFDVSMLEIFDGVFEIHASAGDNYLGGNDFSEVILEDFLAQHKLNRQVLSQVSLEALSSVSDSAKHLLSIEESTKFSLEINAKRYDYTLTRDTFETLCAPLIERLRHPIMRVMSDSGLSSAELAGVILVGGATRMPLFHSQVSRMLGRIPANQYNPDHAIATGACIQAALKARNESLNDIIMVDVCPYTLGVEVNNQHNQSEFMPIIERNQAVPVSETRSVYSGYPGQDQVNIKIYQGESFKPEDNVFLGKLEVPLAKSEELQELLLTYTYDLNGVLEVEVTIASTGVKQRLYIADDAESMSPEQLAAGFEKLKALKVLPRDQAENIALFAKLQRLFEESLGEQREFHAQLTRYFQAELDTHNKGRIEQSRKEIEQRLLDIESY